MSTTNSLINSIEMLTNYFKSSEFKSIRNDATLLYDQNRVTIDDVTSLVSYINNPLNNPEIREQMNNIRELLVLNKNAYLDISSAEIRLNHSNNKSLPIASAPSILGITNIDNSISTQDAINFTDFLTQYPMLGPINNTGDKIFLAIKNAERKSIRNKQIIRIVKYDSRRKNAYILKDLICRPFGQSKQNRFNQYGYSISYFSEDETVLKNEICLEENDRYSKVKISIQKDLVVYDIRDTNIPLNYMAHRIPDKKDDGLCFEYLLPNFIADCAKHAGFDGILYRSVYSNDAINYALFDLRIQDIEIIDRQDFL